MKRKFNIDIRLVGLVLALAAVLYSCGGGSYGGGGGGGGSTAAPGAFSLGAPADTAVSVGTTPTLTWTTALYATGYRVQIDTTGTFAGALVVNAMLSSATMNYAVDMGVLTGGSTYFWRVIAENSYGQSVAGPRSFTS